MSDEREMTLDQMREKRGISEVLFKKFTEAYEYFETHAFCFYEGEDGKYYNSRIEKYWGSNFITQVAGKKKEVLRIMNKIQSDPLYSDVCTMFFIDRDYDDSLANTNDDLFETPCYSIENLYAQESVFNRIMQSEFGISLIDPDYHKCLTDYQLRLEEFIQIIIKFNAVIKYQHQYAQEITCNFSSVKTSHLVHVEIGQVTKAARHDEQITKLISQLNADAIILEQIEEGLRLESNPCLVLRGKNQLDFMVAIIKALKDLNFSGGYFSRKLNNVHINLSDNRLSELSQYAITPPELNEFLEKHKPQVKN